MNYDIPAVNHLMQKISSIETDIACIYDLMDKQSLYSKYWTKKRSKKVVQIVADYIDNGTTWYIISEDGKERKIKASEFWFDYKSK